MTDAFVEQDAVGREVGETDERRIATARLAWLERFVERCFVDCLELGVPGLRSGRASDLVDEAEVGHSRFDRDEPTRATGELRGRRAQRLDCRCLLDHPRAQRTLDELLDALLLRCSVRGLCVSGI